MGFSWDWHQAFWNSHVSTTPRRFSGCWPLAPAIDRQGMEGVQSVYSWGNSWETTPDCSWSRSDRTGAQSAESSEACRPRTAGSSPSVGALELPGGVTGKLANAAPAGCQFIPPPPSLLAPPATWPRAVPSYPDPRQTRALPIKPVHPTLRPMRGARRSPFPSDFHFEPLSTDRRFVLASPILQKSIARGHHGLASTIPQSRLPSHFERQVLAGTSVHGLQPPPSQPDDETQRLLR